MKKPIYKPPILRICIIDVCTTLFNGSTSVKTDDIDIDDTYSDIFI